MAHFARVENGKVKQVIVAEQEFIDNLVSDQPGEWIQCSYNTWKGVHYQRDENGFRTEPSDDQTQALRKNYPGISWNYDFESDAFYPPKPYDSWTLNETTYHWEPPVEKPTDGERYNWNEETQSWDALETE